MAEFTLKAFFSPELVKRLAGELAAVEPSFPSKAFIADATRGLEELELLDRGRQIARAMGTHLPADYPRALDIILRSLGPEHEGDELLGLGMAPFFYYPHGVFVAERGLEHFDLSLDAQVELTKRFTSEATIRPYLVKEPERVFKKLNVWARDANPHVRRLVSEGTRFRLPWAMRVPWLDENPRRVIELLELLKDDPASLVRRSVANNLNDLGKLQPKLLVETAARWLKGASKERRALVEHALRSAIKRGEPGALKLLGFGAKPSVKVSAVSFSPKRVRIGEKLAVNFTLESTARSKQDLLVDLVVHFVTATAKTSRRVFKLERVTLNGAKTKAQFTTSVSMKVHTTRKPHPGKHRVEVLVNGVALPAGSFDVVR